MTVPHVSEVFKETSFPPSWRLLNDVELMNQPDPEYVVAEMIPRRAVGVVYGPSGSAKTTLIAGLCTAVATGREFHGHAVNHKGSCVYVGAEDVPGFKVRLRAAKLAAHLPLEMAIGAYTFPEPVDLRDPVNASEFPTYVRQAVPLPLEVVVVDTYSASMPGATENSSEDTSTAMANARRWSEALNASIVIVHHTNAGGTRERGHSAMRGAADFMISMTPVDDLILVECSKQRNGPPFAPLTLKLVPLPEGGCVLRPAGQVLPSKALTTQQSKALTVLKDSFSVDGATKSEWQRSCPEIPERTFHRVAKVLVERGFVRPVGTHYRVTEQAQ